MNVFIVISSIFFYIYNNTHFHNAYTILYFKVKKFTTIQYSVFNVLFFSFFIYYSYLPCTGPFLWHPSPCQHDAKIT